MLPLTNDPDRFVVAAVARDQAIIWRDGIGAESLPVYVRPPIEVDHRHKRTGQYQHGHDTAHRFPEYFEEIAAQLQGYEGILVMGHGKGKSNYASLLLKYLAKKHPDLFKKVVDVIQVNLTAVTYTELAGHAREWFEKNFRTLASWHDRPIDKRFNH